MFLLLIVLMTGGCGGVPAPEPRPPVLVGEVDTGFVHGTGRGPADQVAAAVVTDASAFWAQRFPSVFGREWRPLAGAFAVDSTDRNASAPPCTGRAEELSGVAQYCAATDTVSWDLAALLPVLRAEYGDGAVVLVLAHELGHAVQQRTGLAEALTGRDPQRYPAIVLETMADCYAGSFVRWAADGHAPHLRITPGERDNALWALLTFRDPAGTTAAASTAHGNGFDRVAAFQDGYEQGPAGCAQLSTDRMFTARAFSDPANPGGNLGLTETLDTAVPDIASYAVRLGSRPPPVARHSPPPGCSGQGPVAYCPDNADIAADPGAELSGLHNDIGDYATVTLLASRFGLAVHRRPVCFAGAYTATLLGRHNGYALSPGDPDEAVRLLLRSDYASRDSNGHGMATGYERLADFRAGVLGGAGRC